MNIKLISSLEKCFLDESITEKTEYTEGSCFKNEIFHFGLCFQQKEESVHWKKYVYLSIKSQISEYIHINRVEVVPVQQAVANSTDNYLRTIPGLYPDVMQPLEANSRLVFANNLKSLMIEIDTKGNVEAGKYPITFEFTEEGHPENVCSTTFYLEILDGVLPEQELIFTQWFYCDSLMDYYQTETFDDEHFRIIENFASIAVKYGINMLLTPIFTPPLDTYVGGERPTMQLVKIRKDGSEYYFDFSLLERWVKMCDRVGIKYFEMPHFFTQWGVKATPKIMATVDGEYKKIFGWETEATSKEYSEFLAAFVPALIDFMKSCNGADKRCYFHISDEPSEAHLENYLKAKAIVAPLLEGYPIIDAVSSYEYYSSGLLERPIPTTDHIDKFIENNVKDLWTYYCISQDTKVSNRFIAMPSYRNRIIGFQLYKYDIVGFLHWGYNFYYNQFSYAKVNPFMCTDAEYFGPAGDAFSVYPGPAGEPWASIRLLVFYDAIQDIRALKLCESIHGKEFVMKLLEENIEPITFADYPRSADYILNVREKINRAIIEKL